MAGSSKKTKDPIPVLNIREFLNILCKRQFQVPAMFFIQKRVTLEAKRMILSTDMSLKEIAFELGFSDPAYFSNFFRAQTGSSPREFKTEL